MKADTANKAFNMSLDNSVYRLASNQSNDIHPARTGGSVHLLGVLGFKDDGSINW